MAWGSVFTVLSNIPWKQVAENAPKVRDAAAGLWNTLGRRKPEPPAQAGDAAASAAAPTAWEALQGRMDIAETRLREVDEQMRRSAELIQALAEQNTQLIATVGAQDARIRRLVVAASAAALVLAAAIGYLLLRT